MTPNITPRRYYLLKRRLETAREQTELAGVWRAKQEAIASPPLAPSFPAVAQLSAAGYTTVGDLNGASFGELLDLGLTRADAHAVLVAMEQLI